MKAEHLFNEAISISSVMKMLEGKKYYINDYRTMKRKFLNIAVGWDCDYHHTNDYYSDYKAKIIS